MARVSAKAAASAGATLDETGGFDAVDITSSAISGLFNTPVYGTDGAGSAVQPECHGRQGPGWWLAGQSGSASEIKLAVAANGYEGWTGGSTSGTKAFSGWMDGNGKVTVTQHAALEHGWMAAVRVTMMTASRWRQQRRSDRWYRPWPTVMVTARQRPARVGSTLPSGDDGPSSG